MDDERACLLGWGRRSRRDLPWRASRDPWAILLAEVMAQQTQVDRVVPRWTEFMRRWPTPAAMAGESLAEVLAAWSGLGYPRRARHLRDAARSIRDHHGGSVPVELRDLLALPGVGSYTARAVQAFAFERDAAVVDTNVGRVLARRSGRRLTPSEAQRTADDWLPSGNAWAWNQSLLDLGAMVCRPVPTCELCPVAPACAWRQLGCPDPDPARGSAGVSRPQAAFEGSRRQARGRLLRAAARAPLAPEDFARVAGWDLRPDAAKAALEVATSLVEDGLAVFDRRGRLAPPVD
jgi:A/G-specific adenine glycosylase